MEPSCPDAARGPPPPLEGPEDAATESGPSRSGAAPQENRHPPLYPPTSSSGPGGAALPSQLHPSPLEPSLSLVPGSAQGGGPEWVGGCDETPVPVSPRIPFGDHAPPSPQSSVASWGSEQTEEPAGGRNTFKEEGSGMKDVPSWLKSLGLQKYTALFSQMTYEEMMTLTEHHLESQNVPRGARQRILLSIQKLRERPRIFKAMEKDIQKGGSVRMALQEPQHITVTPMKAFWRSPAARPANSSSKGAPQGPPHAKAAEAPALNGNIPGLFTRVMGRVCTPLLNLWPDKENITSYLQLLEKCLSHEAVTERQRKRLLSWKWRVQRLLRTFPQKVPPYGPGSQSPQGWAFGSHSLPVAGLGWGVGGQQEQHPFVLHPPVLLPAHLGPAGGAPNPLPPLGGLPLGAQRHQSLCFGCGGAGGSPGSRSAGQQSHSLSVHTSAQAPLALPQERPLPGTDLEISPTPESLFSMVEQVLGGEGGSGGQRDSRSVPPPPPPPK
ncbi:protein Smaug homolog 2-like [Athene noctua]|uniref:protein Smaug homolog 2-like n=1 Tax=Athene noctua TaxID=126797 RepID=UPI003EBDE0B6